MSKAPAKTEATPLLGFEKVTFGYDPAKPILADFTWQVNQGEVWALLGPSGSGKTTLLHLAAGLRRPAVGRIVLDGQPVTKPRQDVGLMLQSYGLLPWYSAARNVQVGLRIRGLDKQKAARRGHEWLQRLELAEVADQFPGQLSGGQRQRVALARVVALESRLLLLDEPLSAVDELGRERLQKRLFEMSRQTGATTLMVTHSVEEAALLADHILLITDHAPIRRYDVLTPPVKATFPRRDDPAFVQFCQTVRTKVGLA
ncbi:ABC transporter ATP-binding protein [soil metagenome]